MPLVAPAIQLKLELEIVNALTSSFAGGDAASHKKLAKAIAAAVAKVIVEELTTNALVLPGIPTAGSPAAQVTVAPGKIG